MLNNECEIIFRFYETRSRWRWKKREIKIFFRLVFRYIRMCCNSSSMNEIKNQNNKISNVVRLNSPQTQRLSRSNFPESCIFFLLCFFFFAAADIFFDFFLNSIHSTEILFHRLVFIRVFCVYSSENQWYATDERKVNEWTRNEIAKVSTVEWRERWRKCAHDGGGTCTQNLQSQTDLIDFSDIVKCKLREKEKEYMCVYVCGLPVLLTPTDTRTFFESFNYSFTFFYCRFPLRESELEIARETEREVEKKLVQKSTQCNLLNDCGNSHDFFTCDHSIDDHVLWYWKMWKKSEISFISSVLWMMFIVERWHWRSAPFFDGIDLDTSARKNNEHFWWCGGVRNFHLVFKHFVSLSFGSHHFFVDVFFV